MRQSSSSLKKRPKYLVFMLSAHCSSRRRFIDPVATQSVPSAMCAPRRAASVTMAVSP
jgi:hypothetical protein